MQAWKRYTQNELNTSNPIKNTIYIYERCIIEFKKLDKALEQLHFSEADLILDKMEKIFEELKLQLNQKPGKNFTITFSAYMNGFLNKFAKCNY